MTREIKFRAWDRTKKAMAEIATLTVGLTTLAWLKDGEREYMVVHGETADCMQFTGLKDKNGKEIYEGDIVKGDWDVVKGIYVSAVDFRGSNFSIEKTGLPLSWGYAHEECEIIGNIYENPDLLDKE